MNSVKVETEGGNSWETGFNGTASEARDYFVGRVFNVGNGPADYFEKVVKITFTGKIKIQGLTVPCEWVFEA